MEDVAVVGRADQAARRARALDGAAARGVFDGAGIAVLADEPAGAAFAGDRDVGVGVPYRDLGTGFVVPADKPAGRVTTGSRNRAADGHVAYFPIVCSCEAPDAAVAGHIKGGEFQVFDATVGGFCIWVCRVFRFDGSEHAEQPDVSVIRPVDYQAVDGTVSPIERTEEGLVRVANRFEALTAVPAGGCAGVDVAAKGVVAAQVVLEQLQLLDVRR